MPELTFTEEELTRLEEETDSNTEELIALFLLLISYDVEIFISRINQTVTTLKNSGLTDQAIHEVLQRDLDTSGRIFGELKNSIKSAVIGTIIQSSKTGQSKIFQDKKKFRWVNVEGHVICDDCLARAGQIETWETWESIGMPGSGWSLCKANCYCILVPEDTDIDDNVKL
tara:strand:+ start:282 stop:794 length:513 start_codon:yes stop_codon:yes gene_type:complete